jgi:hypothetical protein
MAFLSEGSVATGVRVGDRLPHVFERLLSGIRPIEMNEARELWEVSHCFQGVGVLSTVRRINKERCDLETSNLEIRSVQTFHRW